MYGRKQSCEVGGKGPKTREDGEKWSTSHIFFSVNVVLSHGQVEAVLLQALEIAVHAQFSTVVSCRCGHSTVNIVVIGFL